MTDPNAPLVGQDGLEYLNFAAYLEARPLDSYRNRTIQQMRAEGRSAEYVDFWIRFHDEPADSNPA